MPRTGKFMKGVLIRSHEKGVDVAFNKSSGERIILKSLERSRLSTSTKCPSMRGENQFATTKLLLLPAPFHDSKATHHNSHYTMVENVLTADQMKDALDYFTSTGFQSYLISAQSSMGLAKSIRKTALTAMVCSSEESIRDRLPLFPAWLRTRLMRLVLHVDKQSSWKTILREDKDEVMDQRLEVWYNEYRIGDHYAGWHTDQDERHDWTEAPPRALSLVIHLDNATNYQNGQFSVAADGETAHVQFQQNDAIIFPADQLWHKVDKVTQGIRRTISFWISHDPKYVTRV
jgi:hypothetical protein